MNVGVFVPAYTKESGGGYTFEREILETLSELAGESRHQFTIFPLQASADLIRSIQTSARVSIAAIQNQSFPTRWLQTQTARINSIRGKKKSILQAAAERVGVDVMWFATPLYIPVDIPYIATVWDLQHRLQPWFPEVGTQAQWHTRELLFSDLLSRASSIITGNAAGAGEISLFYQIPSHRIRTLPHPCPAYAKPVSAERIRQTLQKYQLEPGFLLYPAQFWAHKNHANLILALQQLWDRNAIRVPLVLVGSNQGNQEYIDQLIRQKKMENQIRILGFIERDDLIALYQSAMALVYVSFFGPENLPPLEAFELGCPVIASAVPGAAEQLGDAALLVDPKNPEAIALAIQEILEQPSKRNELIAKGFTHAAGWTGKDFVRGVFSILDDLETVRRCWK